MGRKRDLAVVAKDLAGPRGSSRGGSRPGTAAVTGMNLRAAVVPLVMANMWTLRLGEQGAGTRPWRTRLMYGSRYS